MFIDNLEAACRSRGTRITPLLKELGISTGNIGKWKSGQEVGAKNLLKISEHLNVSTDFLLTGKQYTPSVGAACINQNEERLLAMYRGLSEQQKGKCYAYIQGMHDAADTGEKSAAV